MPRKQSSDLTFPLGGVVRGVAYQIQQPFTCIDALNTRPRDPFERRLRGGSRPGLKKTSVGPGGTVATPVAMGSGNPVNLLGVVRTLNASGAKVFLDEFDGNTDGQALSDYNSTNWASGFNFDSFFFGNPSTELLIFKDFEVARATIGTFKGGALNFTSVLDTLDTTRPYTVTVDFSISTSQEVYLWIGLDNTTPAVGSSIMAKAIGGTSLQLFIDGASQETKAATGSGDELSITVAGDTIVATYKDATITYDASSYTPAGLRIVLACFAGAGGNLDIDWLRVSYFAGTSTALPPSSVIAASNGTAYYEATDGTMATVSNNTNVDGLTTTIQLAGTSRLEKFYIADYALRVEGTNATTTGANVDKLTIVGFDNDPAVLSDGGDLIELIDVGSTTGNVGVYKFTSTVADPAVLTLTPDPTFRTGSGAETVAYRIVRAVKYFDSSASGSQKLYRLDSSDSFASASLVTPIGCDIMTLYRDRLCLAGDPNHPQFIYMSKVGDPTTWNTSLTTAADAVVFNATDFGIIGEPVTALSAFGADYMFIGASNSMWILRGEPKLGGEVDNITRNNGVIQKGALCHTPFGTLIVLTGDGLYHVRPVPNTEPEPLSRGTLPLELLSIDTDNYDISMAFDHKDQGVHIMVTPRSVGTTFYWWFDWETKSFWPVSLDSDHDPLSITEAADQQTGTNSVVYGCRDGFLRNFDVSVSNDDGTAFESFVKYGPIRLGNGTHDGLLNELYPVLDEQSGSVDWEVVVGDTAEASTTNVTRGGWNGTWVAGRNRTARPRARGAAFSLKISGKGTRWSMESLAAVRETLGKHKVL